MYTDLVRVSLLGTSLYELWLSSTAGTLLNGYASMSDKLAKVSSSVAKDNDDTKKTVGLAVMSSIFSSLSVVFSWYRPGWNVYVAFFNTLLQVVNYRMIQGYWKDNAPSHKTERLPGVGDYTAAWRKMQYLEKVIITCGGGWCLLTMMASPNKMFKN